MATNEPFDFRTLMEPLDPAQPFAGFATAPEVTLRALIADRIRMARERGLAGYTGETDTNLGAAMAYLDLLRYGLGADPGDLLNQITEAHREVYQRVVDQTLAREQA